MHQSAYNTHKKKSAHEEQTKSHFPRKDEKWLTQQRYTTNTQDYYTLVLV